MKVCRDENTCNHDSSDDNQITILHLSDLHFNEENSIEINEVLNPLLDDLKKFKDEFNVIPNVVIISGDIADTGRKSDYDVALNWLGTLLQELEMSPDKIFIVPGNHDIDRNELRKYSKLSFDSEKDVTKFLTKEENEKTAVFKKLDNFFEFIRRFYEDNNPYNGKYYLEKIIQVNEHKIGIVGLNSSWFSGERRYEKGKIVLDKKELIIGEYQARSAYDFTKNTDICITIMHHPFSWLNDFEEGIIKRIVMNNSQLVFHGHIHSSYAGETIEPDSRCLILSAGASYIRNRAKRYSICRINLDDLSLDIYLRIFSDENKFWARDTLTYLSGEGVIHTKLIKIEDEKKEKSPKMYPFDKYDPSIKEFVKQNWKSLVIAEGYKKENILELRRKYFRKSSINPSLHDIALYVVQYLLEEEIIRTEKELEDIIYSPFVRENLNSFEIKKMQNYFDDDYFEEQNKKVFLTSRGEISKLKEREYFVRVERKLRDKIRKDLEKEFQERQHDLEERERELEKEYRIFKSKIDNYQDVEETELPKINPPERVYRNPWYQELGLSDIPFPSHVGLDGFDEEMYEEIIVKTRIFQTLGHEIIGLPRSMQRRSYLIYGSMGSGKTTLFKYLQKVVSMSRSEVHAIFIPLEAQRYLENIRYDFYQKLYEQLENMCFSLTRSPTGIENRVINDSTISSLFKQILENSDISQFIIFIDDLHKHPRYVNEVFEFISGLQIFRSHMYENGINVAIFISGDLAWISDATGLKTIGGSIDTRERIPEISVQDAVEMINRRLKVFARNPNNIPTIKIEYIETVFKILERRIPAEITFRDVVEEVEKHWMNYEFDSLKLSAILDTDTLSSMLLDMKSDHPSIKSTIDSIWEYAERDERIFNQFVEIMGKLYLEGGVSESSHGFIDNEEYYGFLYLQNLISKRKKGYSFIWILTKKLRKMFKKFEEKYGFLPSEYLTKIYVAKSGTRKYAGEESSRMSMILKAGGPYGESFLEYIRNALLTYRTIFRHTTSFEETHDIREIVDLCKKSIVYLSKATMIVCENRDEVTDSLYDIQEEFIDNWFENPDLTEFIDVVQQKETKETDINPDDLKEICKYYFRAVKTTISNLQRFMKYNNVFTLESRLIYTSDKKILNRVRRNFYNDNYALALDRINSLLKKKMRMIIYTVNCLIYGKDKWKRGISPEINKKLIGIAGDFPNDKSVLNNLNLVDLTEIFLKVNDIPEIVFYELFGNETLISIRKELFLEKKLQEVHSKSLIHRGREEILNYILNAKVFVEKVDNFYFMLFSGEIPFLLNYAKFGISLKKGDKKFYKYTPREKITQKILTKIEEEGSVELDFSRFIPYPLFQDLDFIDWIMHIYHINFMVRELLFGMNPNGRVIISYP